jgi:putative nucleotidyltransferase with HDIG domain
MTLIMPPAFFQIFSEEKIATKILTGHNRQRLTNVSFLLGKEVGLSREDLTALVAATLLHDIGKIYIPSRILFNDGPLCSDKRKQVEEHSALGAALLIKLGFPKEVVEAVWSHHENWDGSGYPRGLKGTEISLKARIVRVADSFDAMLNPRSYQLPRSPQEAFSESLKNSGKECDPGIIKLLPKILAIH